MKAKTWDWVGYVPGRTGSNSVLGRRFVRQREGWEEWLGADHGRLFATSRQWIYFSIV